LKAKSFLKVEKIWKEKFERENFLIMKKIWEFFRVFGDFRILSIYRQKLALWVMK
jgi:hypothetical protein